jgi:hypothetical protein
MKAVVYRRYGCPAALHTPTSRIAAVSLEADAARFFLPDM